jgi:hypothetical protein
MKWVFRAGALVLLLVLGSGYLIIGCLALIGDGLGWVMNTTDRLLEKLSAWGEAL